MADRISKGADAPPGDFGRNPPWSRDELILALDLYLRFWGNPPGKGSTEVVGLSEVLNRMVPLGAVNAATFRNANGVYMKAMNFRRFDPAYTGRGHVGLQRGGQLEHVVWDEFAHDPTRLQATAEAIKATIDAGLVAQPLPDDEDEMAEASEGRTLTRAHLVRERSRKLVQRRKALELKQRGRLACEVCAFTFEDTYGPRGKNFIEVHHTKPLHTLGPGSVTKLADLAVVCANCHRMIHAATPWLTIEELKRLIGRP